MSKVTSIQAAERAMIQEVTALGNSKLSMEQVAADLLNAAGRKNASLIAADCFLSTATVVRVMEDGGSDLYKPQCETIKRIYTWAGMEVVIRTCRGGIKARYANKPKE